MITHGLGDLFRLTNFERGGKSSWPCALKCLSPLLNFILWEKPTRCNNLFISLNAIPHQQRCTSGEKNYIFSKQKRVFVFFFYSALEYWALRKLILSRLTAQKKKKIKWRRTQLAGPCFAPSLSLGGCSISAPSPLLQPLSLTQTVTYYCKPYWPPPPWKQQKVARTLKSYSRRWRRRRRRA